MYCFLFSFSFFVVVVPCPMFQLNRVECDDNAKPLNLANSAVLKLLEEEERQKQAGGKRNNSSFFSPKTYSSHLPRRTQTAKKKKNKLHKISKRLTFQQMKLSQTQNIQYDYYSTFAYLSVITTLTLCLFLIFGPFHLLVKLLQNCDFVSFIPPLFSSSFFFIFHWLYSLNYFSYKSKSIKMEDNWNKNVKWTNERKLIGAKENL